MPGITRIKIEGDWYDWRVQLSQDHATVANAIYRDVFDSIGMGLSDGSVTVSVTKEEAAARYDWSEGIDVILRTETGERMTLQEKFLTYHKSTITFEERKTSGKRGFWYYGTPQYYFVGYTREYWDWYNRCLTDDPVIDFQDWILVDFPSLRRESSARDLGWGYGKNKKDGRRATFRYLNFDRVPGRCIVARHEPSYEREVSQSPLF